MKTCKTCNELKNAAEYSKLKSSLDGLQLSCKSCEKIRMITYSRSLSGFIVKLHQNQKHSAKRREQEPPSYSRIELDKWLRNKPLFIILYNKWVRSGYERDLAPSLDRLDESRSYHFDNVKIMPWWQNNLRGHNDRKTITGTKQSRAVIQLSLDGEFIAEFISARAAKAATGVEDSTIGRVCNGKRGILKHDKYIWKHKGDS